jgi:ribonuclease VapC
VAAASRLSWVADASAVLAFVLGEEGAEWMEPRIERCGLSVVNLEEVLARLADRGGDPSVEMQDVLRLGLAVLPFDATDAAGVAALRPATAARGLSLGDRTCLWTARAFRVPAVTADGAWTRRSDGSVPKRAQLEGVTVLQLRPHGPLRSR